MSNPPEHQYITKTEGVCGGAACVAGTRVSVATIVELAENASPTDLHMAWPGVGWPALVAALQYALKYPMEIKLERAEQDASMRALITTPAAPVELIVGFKHSTVGGMMVYLRTADDAPWVPVGLIEYGAMVDTARTEREWLAKNARPNLKITVYQGEPKLD